MHVILVEQAYAEKTLPGVDYRDYSEAGAFVGVSLLPHYILPRADHQPHLN